MITAKQTARRTALIFAFAAFASPLAAQGINLPVHGNWCGPGHFGGMPIDLLDAACMRHDFCTVEFGPYTCGCDLSFMQELRAVSWPNPYLAEKAHAVYEAMAIVPCDGPGGQAKVDMALNDWAGRVAAGQEAPWAVLERLGRLATEGLARSN